MFYYILFFISTFISTITRADIAPEQFDEMLQFINTVDLKTSSTSDYKKFMRHAEQIVDNGSAIQRTQLKNILDASKSIDTELDDVAEILNSDVVTPDVWQKTMNTLKKIDAYGSALDKTKLEAFINRYKNKLMHHIRKVIDNIWYDNTVKETLASIAWSVFSGSLPSVAITALSISMGNTSFDSALMPMTNLAVLCALDSLVRLGLKKENSLSQATIAAGMSTAIQNFIHFTGPNPSNLTLLGATVIKPTFATLQAAGLDYAQKSLTVKKIKETIFTLDYVKAASLGDTQLIAAQSQETRSLVGYVQNALAVGIKKPIVRAVIANTVTYAVEGALMAAALNMAGLGEYGSTTEEALAFGAFQGLMQHASREATRAGIFERVENGIMIKTVQNALVKGLGTSWTDIVPMVTQQVITGAVEGLVEKTGGWKAFITDFFKQ